MEVVGGIKALQFTRLLYHTVVRRWCAPMVTGVPFPPFWCLIHLVWLVRYSLGHGLIWSTLDDLQMRSSPTLAGMLLK